MKDIKICQSDEVCAEVNLANLGEISIIYLDQSSPDDFFLSAINRIVDHDESITRELMHAAHDYIDKVAPNGVDKTVEVMSIFIYDDRPHEIGVSLHWDGDVEHGIGIKMIEGKVINIGMEDILFS